MEEQDYAGCCGLYCGLCPRFQSTAPSRCLGCHLGEQHSYCSVYRCCVMKRGHRTCADCGECPCERLLRVIGEGVDSFISHKPARPNLERIREAGMATYLEEQRARRLVVEYLLSNYNEGRSMTFYCTAGALLPPSLLRRAIDEVEGMVVSKKVDEADVKARAKAMKGLLQDRAAQAGVDLRLRKKR